MFGGWTRGRDDAVSLEMGPSLSNFQSAFTYSQHTPPDSPNVRSQARGVVEGLLLLLVWLLLPVTWWLCVRRVTTPHLTVVTQRWGRAIVRTSRDGYYAHLPTIDTDHVIDMRSRHNVLSSQQLVTSDSGVIGVSGEVTWCIADAQRYTAVRQYTITGGDRDDVIDDAFMTSLVKTSLKSAVASNRCGVLVKQRSEVQSELMRQVNDQASSRGLQCCQIVIEVEVIRPGDPLASINPLLGHVLGGARAQPSPSVISNIESFVQLLSRSSHDSHTLTQSVVARMVAAAVERAPPHAPPRNVWGMYRVCVTEPSCSATLVVNEDGCTVLDEVGPDSQCDVTVSLTQHDLGQCLTGGRSWAVSAAMSGKMHVDGDMAKLASLVQFLSQ